MVSPATGYADASSLVIGPERTTAVWAHWDGTENSIQTAFSLDHGLTWSEPVPILDPAPSYQGLQVIDANGRLTVSWLSDVGSDRVVQNAWSVDGGLSWSAPVNATPTPGYAGEHQLIAHGDFLVLAWSNWDGVQSTMWAARSADGGASWNGHVQVSPAALDAVSAQLASTDGAVALVYWTYGSFNGIQAVSSSDGLSWSTPVDVSDPSDTVTSQQLAADGTSVLATWYGGIGGINTVQLSRSDDGGLTWSEPLDITGTDPGDAAYYPEIAVSGALAALLWWEWDGSNYLMRAATSTDGGATWTVSDFLSIAGYNASSHRVVNNGTTVTAIWQRNTMVGTVVETAYYDGGEWSAAQLLSETETAGAPSIVTDQTAVVAAWRSSDEDSAAIYASTRILALPATGSTFETGLLLLAMALLAMGVATVGRATKRS